MPRHYRKPTNKAAIMKRNMRKITSQVRSARGGQRSRINASISEVARLLRMQRNAQNYYGRGRKRRRLTHF